ncbi:MAG: hypothetical protein ACREFD_00595 [Stellaceae bacterium]
MEKPPVTAVMTTSLRRPLLWAALGLFIAFELTLLFEASALTLQNSDNLQAVLEASDILDGNVLLHGWVLALQNYYLTDLPFYLATRVLFGRSLLAINAATYLIYVLLLLGATGIVSMAARAPRDRAIGLAAVVFYLATPGRGSIAPLIFVGTQHIASLGFCLVAWFALDKIERAATLVEASDYRVLYVVCAFIALFSDPLADVVFLVPTLIGLLFALAVPRRRQIQAGAIGLTLAALVAAHGALLAVRAMGGFATVFPEPIRFVAWGQLGGNISTVLFGLLKLSGADIFGRALIGGATLLALLRLAGLAVVVAAMVVALRRGLVRAGQWRISFIVALAALIQLASCVVSQDYADSLLTVAPLRFLVPTIIFGGVVAALELPEMLRAIAAAAPRWAFVGLCGAGLIAGVIGFAAEGIARWNEPPAIASMPDRTAGAWLLAHHLTRGVGGYWEGTSITALTGEQVAVRAVIAHHRRLVPYIWVAKPSWYRKVPQFVIYKPINRYGISERSITAKYGPLKGIEHVAGYDIALLASPE